jgi:hypothetical protein
MSDYQWGFGLEIGFINHLQVITRSNYNTITNFHNSQITIVHAKPFQSAVTSRFAVMDLNNENTPSLVLPSLPTGSQLYEASLLFTDSLTTD